MSVLKGMSVLMVIGIGWIWRWVAHKLLLHLQ